MTKEELELELDRARIAASSIADSFRDLFNEVGEIEEVRKAFEKVEQDIKEWESKGVRY